jgi:hypothetical protein
VLLAILHHARYLVEKSSGKMASLVPREPYSSAELEKLYPRGLDLQLVQIVSEILAKD